jgi:hypothetical protein
MSQLDEQIKTPWDAISSESIIKRLTKFCIANKLDSSKDNILWKGHTQDQFPNEKDSN